MKRILLSGVLFSLALTINSFAADKTTFRLAWWGNPTRDARTLKVVELYMKKNPGITVETEYTGWGGYWDKIAAQAAANNLPDIMQHDYAYLLQYVGKDLVIDLTPYIKAKKLNLNNVNETFISGGKVNNKYYGISLGTNAVCMVYDPAILQKAGIALPNQNWTWTDFEKIAVEVYKKTGVQTLPFFTTDPKVGFENWIRQTGYPFFSPDGTALGFKDEKPLIEFFSLQLKLLKSKVLISPDIAFVGTTQEEDPFSKGKSWVQFIWSNQVVATQIAANRPINIILMPKITKAKRPGTYLKPSMFFAVTKSVQNKDEVIKFFNFFLNDIEANKILLAERGIPVVPDVRNAIKEMMNPVEKQVSDYIDLVGNNNSSPIDPPDPANTGEVLKIFRTMDQEVLYQTTSPKDAALKFMKEAKKILAKNKR